ncbi:MAG: ATP-binding cassette domain-containing protein [Polaromonas sp.]|nr:ATP-binding cassette domain-containing protein [Polaromonas sp.]
MNITLDKCSARHPAAKSDAPDALKALGLNVSSGEQLAIIGPSGAGKTTLLHLLACALQPSGGTLEMNGRNPWALARRTLHELRGELFLAPQVPPLPPRQRVITAVLAGRLPQEGFWASVRSLFYPNDIALAEGALAQFDVSDKLFDRVDRLSGGERQRVGLARALASQAGLFLVDEPLSALDPTRAQQAIESLTQAARLRGATLVTTLHHVEMALQHFPRIIGLRDGALAFDLPAAQVTPERLRQLYEQHLDELTGPSPTLIFDAPPTTRPVALTCR